MASTKDIGLTKGRRALLFTVLTLALICGLGFAYLGMPAVDLNQYVTAGLGAPSQRPPVSKEEKPSQAHLLAPSFDIASVDERGTLVAAGRSEAGWTIQLKSKSRILGETKADDNNEWVLTPEASLPPGEHTLSLLAIDPTGQRSLAGEQESRIIVAPRRVAAQTPQTPVPALQASGRAAASPELALTPHVGQGAGKEGCSSAVVKSGDTLWAIAHNCYGSGTKYTKILQSNRSLIRNPHLIYPDQRFAVPR
ncbi:MAG: LysM peptidoglycan-binding domain-containing protein [Rhodomicrobium sp.]